MKRLPVLFASVALLGASLFPMPASAQGVVINDDGSVHYDTTHSGRSVPFHLDGGDYTFDWGALVLEDGVSEAYCGIALQVVTDEGRTIQGMLVNEIVHYSGGAFIPLNGIPSGRYSINVFGCADLTSSISPA